MDGGWDGVGGGADVYMYNICTYTTTMIPCSSKDTAEVSSNILPHVSFI